VGVAGVDQPTAPVAHVLVAGRNEQRASDVVAEIEHGGGSAAYRLTTLADVTSARELARWATETGDGHADILVNNVDTALLGPSESGTEAEFDETFTINVKVPFFLVAALAPAMAARGWGAIVNISTMVASFGRPGMAMYGASRAALEPLTRAWAAEYGPRGVRVNAVAPGPVRTPITCRNWPGHRGLPTVAVVTVQGLRAKTRRLRRMPVTMRGGCAASGGSGSRGFLVQPSQCRAGEAEWARCPIADRRDCDGARARAPEPLPPGQRCLPVPAVPGEQRLHPPRRRVPRLPGQLPARPAVPAPGAQRPDVSERGETGPRLRETPARAGPQLILKPAQPVPILHGGRSGHLLIPVFSQSMIIQVARPAVHSGPSRTMITQPLHHKPGL
jgi:NAD(P)-dependent dehydrogenase (short-subunit alcohol dehydrogenase family)